MLKSTHKALPPLPAPWTEHRAPTGHTYYYNPETKQSTYARPSAEPAVTSPPPNPEPTHYGATFGWSNHVQPDPTFASKFGSAPSLNATRGVYQHRGLQDRPKTRHTIPGHRHWILIKTKLGRRFVHNLETKESLWKIPQDLIAALVEFDITEREKAERKARGEEEEVEVGHNRSKGEHDSGSDEYEEVEVTDSEYESEGHPPKRQKTIEPSTHDEHDEDVEYAMESEDEQPQKDAPEEFGEEEMAAQLAAMGESYDLDPSEYYAADEAYEGMKGEPAPYELTEEEAAASFRDLLDDHSIDPFATWDNVIDTNNRSSEIVSDDRYTLLTNMRARKEIFSIWSVDRIAALKSQREKQIKQNPRIPFLALLSNHATPKLFWAEFKRKWKREPEIRDVKLGDKEKEKLYREYITRITKTADDLLKEDLKTLMNSVSPSSTWNRSSRIDGVMPEALLADVKYVAVKPKDRERLVSDFVRTLPTAEEVASKGEMSEEEICKRQERARRDEAMRRRGEEVESARRNQGKDLMQSQRRLRREELELERASRVGKSGLRQNLE